MRHALVWLVVAGCGRVDFAPLTDAAPDVPPDALAPCFFGVRLGDLGPGRPSVRATGSGFASAWVASSTVEATQVDAYSLPVLSTASLGPITTPGRTHRPTLAPRNGEVGIVWDDTAVHLRIVDVQGVAGADRILVAAPRAPRDPVITATLEGYAVAWSDTSLGAAKIFYMRLDPTGTMLGAIVQVSSAAVASTTPSIAWSSSSSQLLVAWSDAEGGGRIRAQRIDANGTLVGTVINYNTGSPATAPVVTALDTGYAIVWLDDHTTDRQVGFLRINATGDLVEGPKLSTAITGWAAGVDLTWTGTSLALALAQEVNAPTDRGDGTLYGELDLSGNLLAPLQVIAPNFSSDSQFPAVAVEGSRTLIVQNQTASPMGPGVYAFCR